MSSYLQRLYLFWQSCRKFGEGCSSINVPRIVLVIGGIHLVVAAANQVRMYYQVNTNPPCPPIDSARAKDDKPKKKTKSNGGDKGGDKGTLASSGTGVNGGEVIEAAKPMDDLDNDSDHDQSECVGVDEPPTEQIVYTEDDDGTHRPDTTTAESMLYERWRLKFNEKGELREEDGGRFRFDAYGTDRMANQERYEEIGQLTEAYVYDLLQAEDGGNLVKTYLQEDERGTFIFVSKNWEECDKLLVLIHGSGAVRAGQWARRLIINDNLDSGTQLPYITRAHSQEWGVIVMNTNDNYNGVEGSRSPNEHGLYVWKHFVRKSQAKKIAIVAHSAGGSVTASMVSDNFDDFRNRVYAIAYTDSFGSPHENEARKYFEDVTCNWVTGIHKVGKPMTGRGVRCVCAGTTKHEETSHYAIDDIFKYIEERFERTTPVMETPNTKKRPAEPSSSKVQPGASGLGPEKPEIERSTGEKTKKQRRNSPKDKEAPTAEHIELQQMPTPQPTTMGAITTQPTHADNPTIQSNTKSEERKEENVVPESMHGLGNAVGDGLPPPLIPEVTNSKSEEAMKVQEGVLYEQGSETTVSVDPLNDDTGPGNAGGAELAPLIGMGNAGGAVLAPDCTSEEVIAKKAEKQDKVEKPTAVEQEVDPLNDVTGSGNAGGAELAPLIGMGNAGGAVLAPDSKSEEVPAKEAEKQDEMENPTAVEPEDNPTETQTKVTQMSDISGLQSTAANVDSVNTVTGGAVLATLTPVEDNDTEMPGCKTEDAAKGFGTTVSGDAHNGQVTPDLNKNLGGNEAPAQGGGDPPGVHVTLPMQRSAPLEKADGDFTQLPAYQGKEEENIAGGQDGMIIENTARTEGTQISDTSELQSTIEKVGVTSITHSDSQAQTGNLGVDKPAEPMDVDIDVVEKPAAEAVET